MRLEEPFAFGSPDLLDLGAMVDVFLDPDFQAGEIDVDFPLVEAPDLRGVLRPDGTVAGRKVA
jgi:hypothetical protein